MLKTEIHGDPDAHLRSLAYFDNLRLSPIGHEVCLSLLNNGFTYDGRVRLFCLTHLENYVITHDSLSEEMFVGLKDCLCRYVQVYLRRVPKRPEDEDVRNKAVDLFVKIFIKEHAKRWKTFLSDLLRWLNVSQKATLHCLLVLSRIPDVTGGKIRELVNERHAEALVLSWYHILERNPNKEIIITCLSVVAKYAPLIQVALEENKDLLDAILNKIGSVATRTSATSCFHAIIQREMPPYTKHRLVEMLFTTLSHHGLLNPQGAQSVSVGKLLNTLCLELLQTAQNATRNGNRDEAKILWNSVQERTNLAISFMKQEKWNVALLVMPFLQQYFSVQGEICQDYRQGPNAHIDAVLEACWKQLSFVENVVTHSEISSLLVILVSVDKPLVLRCVHGAIQDTIVADGNGSSTRFVRVISLLEAADGVLRRDSTSIPHMLNSLIDSDIMKHSSPFVLEKFFNITVRYASYLRTHPDIVQKILLAYLNHCRHKSSPLRLQSRFFYLLWRFLSTLKGNFSGNDPLKRLHDLMLLDDAHTRLRQRSQKYLARTISLLAAASSSSVAPQILQDFLSPTLNRFFYIIQQMNNEDSWEIDDKLSTELCQTFSIATSFTEGFNDLIFIQKVGCLQVYQNVVHTLLVNNHFSMLVMNKTNFHREAVLFIKRIVVILEDEFLCYIPGVVNALATSTDDECIYQTVRLLILMIHKYKSKILSFLQDEFSNLLSNLFKFKQLPFEECVKRGCLEYMLALMKTDLLWDVLRAQDKSLYQRIISEIIKTAHNSSDVNIQKHSFALLLSFSKGVKISDCFVRESTSACWSVPLKYGLDPEDRDQRKVLLIAAECLWEMLNTGRRTYFMIPPPEIISKHLLSIEEYT